MGRGYKAVYRDGRLVAEYEHGELTYFDPMYWQRKRSDLAAPTIIRDIGEYRSPLDNSMITSRSAHREHMRTHGVVEVGNERMQPAPETTAVSHDIGEQVKKRLEEVKALPQAEYDHHVHTQKAEHAEIASLITAS